VEIGGASGQTLDLALSDQATDRGGLCTGACYILSFSTGWSVSGGLPDRVWVLDVDGETVLIATDAPEDEFADWTTEVEDVLSTIAWTQ
jgi:hypothetical protein